MWDLDLYVFQIDPAQSNLPWPGFRLLQGKGEKGVAASRRRDTVAVYLRLDGVPGLSPRVPEQLAEQAARTYLQTHGSVTRALTEAAQVVHQRIERANRRLARREMQARGWFLAFVLRGEVLYLAWSGPWHVLATVRGQLHRWHDPERSGPGLGEQAALHFAQVPLRFPLVVLAAEHLEGLREEEALVLADAPEHLLQTWLSRERPPRGGLLARWEAGTYQVTKTYLPIALPEAQGKPEPQAPAVRSPQPAPTPAPAPEHREPEALPEAVVEEAKKPARPSGRRKSGRLARGLAHLAWSGLGVLSALTRIRVPTRMLVFLSLLLPLLVMGLTLTRYMQVGRKLRHEQWLAVAAARFREALEQQDAPQARLQGVEQALEALRQAETYGQSPESRAMKQNLYQWLETWEYIYLLPFQDALDAQLPRDAQIERLTAGTQGLYALDLRNQEVWYFPVVAQGSALDRDERFRCRVPAAAGVESGPLTDILTLDPRDSPYELAAFDELGNMLLCSPEREALLRILPVPTRPWEHIFRVRAFEGLLYVLDVGQGNIFVLEAPNPAAGVPRSLFPPEAPKPDLDQVVDFAVWRGEMFLLFVDGRVMRCIFPLQEEAATQCEPLAFRDRRPERAEQTYPIWPNTRFAAMDLYRGPEPTLFFLDALQGRVFRFSLKLRYLAQYRPETPWPQVPTTFLVQRFGNTPYLFVATTNDIYAAALP